MIISIGMEKAFYKIQYPSVIKTFNILGIEGTYLNKIKARLDRPIANIILNGERLKAFPPRSVIRHGCHLHIPIQHSWKS